MPKLSTLALSVMLCLTSPISNADCKDALNKADAVIQKQEELIDLMVKRYDTMMTEQEIVNQQMDSLQSELKRAKTFQWGAGSIGFALGIATTVMIYRRL